MKTTSVLKKLFVKVVDLANSFPAKAERFLYVKKQLRYVDFKMSHFFGGGATDLKFFFYSNEIRLILVKAYK